MSKIALGTAQFGLNYGIANSTGQISHTHTDEVLDFAISNGVNLLDTAIAYGESEANLGRSNIKAFNVVTKLPAVPESCEDPAVWVEQQLADSLSRLGLNSIYGLLLHRPNQLLGGYGQEIYQALLKLKQLGKVQKIGLSIYTPSELDSLLHKYPVDLIQAPLNLLDRRIYTSGWLNKLKDLDVEVHTRSAFLQGLLLMSKSAIPIKFSPWVSLFDKWHTWLLSQNISALQACINFPLSLEEVDRVVVGVDTVSQLKQIINLSNLNLDVVNFPDLSSEDELLINPANWSKL